MKEDLVSALGAFVVLVFIVILVGGVGYMWYGHEQMVQTSSDYKQGYHDHIQNKTEKFNAACVVVFAYY